MQVKCLEWRTGNILSISTQDTSHYGRVSHLQRSGRTTFYLEHFFLYIQTEQCKNYICTVLKIQLLYHISDFFPSLFPKFLKYNLIHVLDTTSLSYQITSDILYVVKTQMRKLIILM